MNNEDEIIEIENNTDLEDSQIVQLAEYFEVEPEDIEESGYDAYDLTSLKIDGCTYLFAEDYDDGERAARESVSDFFDDMPSGFSSWVLCDNMLNDISLESVEDLIKHELNEVIRELVNVEGLIDDCIGYDGIGQNLASYDGEALEIEGMYLFRTD